MKVVVIGAGVGGVACAKRLSERAKDIHIVVIDPAVNHDFAPSFLWLLNGARNVEQVSRPIDSISNWGVELVSECVTGIDLGAQNVTTTSSTVSYDELVVAPGAELNFADVPGLGNASSFYTKDAAADLGATLSNFNGGRVQIVVPSMPYKCPAAPYEAAFLIEAYLRRRGVESQVGVHTVEPQPMPVAGPAVGDRVASMLEKRGIAFRPDRTLGEVDENAQVLRFADDVERYDLLIAIPPHRAPAFVRDSELAGPNGWIPVDRHTLRAADHVHAIGDVTAIPLANGKPLPKAGVFANEQARVVADNLIAIARGHETSARFAGHGSCFLEIGRGKAGVARGDFFAEPDPQVRLFPPTRVGHLGKVLFERKWLGQFD
ncbi:MAG: NAD(P)/FAD-dependent oxidoreductase [Solirubrobacterales bacterium]